MLYVFSIPLIVGLIHIILNNNNIFTFIKIIGGLSVTILFFYYIIRELEFSVSLIFSWYIQFCFILSLIGLIQVLSYNLGFKIGYDYRWILNKWGVIEGGLAGIRVNSILSEPTYLATVISPAMYVALRNIITNENLFINRFKSIIIIIISILTTSTIGYLGLILSLLLCTETVRLRYIVFGVLISVFAFSLAYNYVDDFSQRVNAAKGLWIDSDFKISNTNNSSFVLYNNLHIAQENLKNYPFFGTGLGSHEIAFKKFSLTKSLIQYDFEFNIKDGNSLFVRLCSETGLVGLIFILVLLIKGFIYKVDKSNFKMVEHKVISQSIFVLILLVLIRQGNYMLNGLPLLFLLYYFNSIHYKEKLNHIE
tara:strand:- start:610 stop:1707 length:1098 start_codon:yes stop_codon:yes gene_type:complete